MVRNNEFKFRMKGLFVLIAVFIAWTAAGVCQGAEYMPRVEIPSSPNPVGSGARALGMGGAFISIADDATAASWNPGGLIQLELPEISIVGALFHRIEDNTFDTRPEASGKQTVDKNALNYLSAAYPFQFKNFNMIVSLNYQNLYDFTRKWNFRLVTEGEDSSVQNIDYQSEGSLSAVGLAYCIQITPRLSLGTTLNLWDNNLCNNEWDDTRHQWGSGIDKGDAYNEYSISHDEYTFSGININFGGLWSINNAFTLGFVVKSGFDADISHSHSLYVYDHFPNLPGFDTEYKNQYDEDGELFMPWSCGVGLAYRFSDELTFAVDLYRTEWDDFIYTDGDGHEISPITGKPSAESKTDSTNQLRFGAEYLFIMPKYVIPVRGGLFYDPSPAEGSPDDFYGFALGSGFAYKRYIFDIAYQYRFGNGARDYIMENWGFSQDVDEHTLYASFILHF